MNHHSFPIAFICILFLVGGALGFTPPPRTNIIISTTTHTDDVLDISSFYRQSQLYSYSYSSPSDSDPQELIARRIVVTGAVSGGYYRSCVKNEGSRFRKLVGTMTPPEENSQRAEIYVEVSVIYVLMYVCIYYSFTKYHIIPCHTNPNCFIL